MDRADLPTGIVTFLFTDIEGSTRLVARLGERYASVLADHQRLLRDAFAASAGREIDTLGDAFFVVFPRAKSAVAAALAGLRALARHRWPDRDERAITDEGKGRDDQCSAEDLWIIL